MYIHMRLYIYFFIHIHIYIIISIGKMMMVHYRPVDDMDVAVPPWFFDEIHAVMWFNGILVVDCFSMLEPNQWKKHVHTSEMFHEENGYLDQEIGVLRFRQLICVTDQRSKHTKWRRYWVVGSSRYRKYMTTVSI